MNILKASLECLQCEGAYMLTYDQIWQKNEKQHVFQLISISKILYFSWIFRELTFHQTFYATGQIPLSTALIGNPVIIFS